MPNSWPAYRDTPERLPGVAAFQLHWIRNHSERVREMRDAGLAELFIESECARVLRFEWGQR